MMSRLFRRIGILLVVVVVLLVGSRVFAQSGPLGATNNPWAQVLAKLDQILAALSPAAPQPGPGGVAVSRTAAGLVFEFNGLAPSTTTELIAGTLDGSTTDTKLVTVSNTGTSPFTVELDSSSCTGAIINRNVLAGTQVVRVVSARQMCNSLSIVSAASGPAVGSLTIQ